MEIGNAIVRTVINFFSLFVVAVGVFYWYSHSIDSIDIVVNLGDFFFRFSVSFRSTSAILNQLC